MAYDNVYLFVPNLIGKYYITLHKEIYSARSYENYEPNRNIPTSASC